MLGDLIYQMFGCAEVQSCFAKPWKSFSIQLAWVSWERPQHHVSQLKGCSKKISLLKELSLQMYILVLHS